MEKIRKGVKERKGGRETGKSEKQQKLNYINLIKKLKENAKMSQPNY